MALKLTAVEGAKAAIQQESAAEQDVFLMGEELKWAVSIMLTEAQQTVKDMIEEGKMRVNRTYRDTLGGEETASYIDNNNHVFMESKKEPEMKPTKQVPMLMLENCLILMYKQVTKTTIRRWRILHTKWHGRLKPRVLWMLSADHERGSSHELRKKKCCDF